MEIGHGRRGGSGAIRRWLREQWQQRQRVVREVVHPPLADDFHANGAGVSEHAEMLGRQRLRNSKSLNQCGDVRGACAKRVENSAPGGIGDHREGVHPYISLYNHMIVK